MLDEGIFHCFSSAARIDRRTVKIGVEESIALKQKAIFRGMARKDGKLRARLSWLEQIVLLMRDATTGERFNHEWWAAEASKPEWVKRLDEFYAESWLYYPQSGKQLVAVDVGNKLGYLVTLDERAFELAASNRLHLKKWEAVELEKARRGREEWEAKKVRLVLTGYDSWKEFADQVYANVLEMRKAVFAIASTRAKPNEFAEFVRGFNAGGERASKIDLTDRLSEFSERNEVVTILQDHWPTVDQMRDRAEISAFILKYLPRKRQTFLKDEIQWQSFVGRLRDIYRKIRLGKAGRGRPRKKGRTESK